MKNKKLIVIIAAALVAVAVAVTLIVTLGGSKLDKCAKMLDKSAQTLTEISSESVVTDSGVEVRKYLYKVEMIEKDGEVTEVNSTLNSSGVFSTVEDIKLVENLNRDQLINFNLNKEFFQSVEYKNDILTLSVKGDKISQFLNVEGLALSGEEATAIFTFNEGVLEQAVVNYTLQTGKIVTLTVVCKY